jgi:CRP/FNR family transcriptional regulator, cyclic AMP receptor protein
MSVTAHLATENLRFGVNGQKAPMSSAQSKRMRHFGMLDTHALFASLPANIIREIETALIVAKHQAGSVLYRQGQSAREVFLVFDGRVKLTSITMHARTALLKVAGAGEVLGLAEVLSDHDYLTTAEATTSSLLGFLQCDDLMNALRKYPELSRAIAGYLAKEAVRSGHETLSLRVPCSSSQRLAAALLHLSNGGNGFRSNGTLIYTHAELAQLIGASRETVTRLIKRFEEKAMIAPKKSALTIIDPKLLEQEAESG